MTFTKGQVFTEEHKELFKGGLDNWKKDRQEIFQGFGWKIEYFDETQVNENEVLRRIG